MLTARTDSGLNLGSSPSTYTVYSLVPGAIGQPGVIHGAGPTGPICLRCGEIHVEAHTERQNMAKGRGKQLPIKRPPKPKKKTY